MQFDLSKVKIDFGAFSKAKTGGQSFTIAMYADVKTTPYVLCEIFIY